MGKSDRMMELFYILLLVVEWLHDFLLLSKLTELYTNKMNFNICKLCFNKELKIYIVLMSLTYIYVISTFKKIHK